MADQSGEDTQAAPAGGDDLSQKIEKIFEEKIRPALAMEGGGIELVGVDEGVVQVKLQGACSGCPGAAMTLKMGVERILRSELPEVTEVVPV